GCQLPGGRKAEDARFPVATVDPERTRYRRTHGILDMPFLDRRIHETERLGLIRMDRLSGQHHRHRLDRINERRQPERAAETGMDTEHDFGEAEFRIADGDPVPAGERDLQPAAETVAVNHRHGRYRKPGEAIDDGMRPRHAGFHPMRFRHVLEIADIRPRDEAALLGGTDDEAFGAHAFYVIERIIELGHDRLRKRVSAIIGTVEDQPRYALAVFGKPPMVEFAGWSAPRAEFHVARL